MYQSLQGRLFPDSVRWRSRPDPVVVWPSESAAQSFIDKKGGADDFQAVAIDDGSLDAMAKAMGCPMEQITLEPYPI